MIPIKVPWTKYPVNPRINWSSPQARNLVSSWPLVNDNAGSTHDITGRPHVQTRTSRPTIQALPSVDGLGLTASSASEVATLDSNNGFGDLAGTTNDIALSFWCRTSSIAARAVCVTDFKWTTFGDRSCYIRIETDGTWTSWWDGTGANNGTWHAGSVAVDTDYHVVWQLDWSAKVAKLYINGVQQGGNVSLSGMTAIYGGNNVHTHGEDGVGNGWPGEVWDLRLYDKIFTQDEVLELYHNPLDLFEPRTIWVPVEVAAAQESGVIPRQFGGYALPPVDAPFEINHASPQADGLIGWWPVLSSESHALKNQVTGDSLMVEEAIAGDAGSFDRLPSGMPVVTMNGAAGGSNKEHYGQTAAESVPYQLTGDLTISAVIKHSSIASSQAYLAMTGVSGETEAANYLFAFYRSSSNNFLNLFWEYGAGVNGGAVSTTLSPAVDTEYIVTVRRNDSDKTVDFFMNDEEDLGVSYTNSATGGTSAGLSIGRSGLYDGGYLQGAIRDVRIHNKALPLSVIRARHNPSTQYDLYKRNPILIPVGAPAASDPPVGGGNSSVAIWDRYYRTLLAGRSRYV